ncbi:hypothetical protein GCM10019016_120960 [Streptomyces prasinosporus]|uniref:Uncharacterized protein n=1 Tax=Streptomyces prasinosporus TaxID=68256 RepID=A0ABP6UE21_9ACTN
MTRGAPTARETGSSWYGSTATPERNGAWRVLASAEATADQRTASRNAARRFGGVEGAGGGVGEGAGGQHAAAGLDLPDDGEGVAEAAVGDGLEVHEGGGPALGVAVGGGGRLDAGDDPGLAAHLDQVALLGEPLGPRPLGPALGCWRHGRCSPRYLSCGRPRTVCCLPTGPVRPQANMTFTL